MHDEPLLRQSDASAWAIAGGIRQGAGLSEASHGPLQGTVTQVTDVKPLLTVATYLDRNQATEAYQEVSGKSRIPEMPHKHPHFSS